MATARTRTTGWVTPRGDERRDAILAALSGLLDERSLAEISVSMLTERAGVTRSGFYFYFTSKSAAVVALLADRQERMLTLAHAWYAGSPVSAQERLRDGMRASIAEWRHDARWFVAILDAVAADPDAAAVWRDWVGGFAERVAEVIERDVGDRLRAAGGPSSRGLATALVEMIFRLMERDVRSVAAGGEGEPELEEVLVHTWHRTIYGEAGP